MKPTDANQKRTILSWIGVFGACAVWLVSALALVFAMGHGTWNSPFQPAQSAHATGSRHAQAGSADLLMAVGCMGFTLLQLASFLLFAFVFRAAWRLRSAVCFSLAAGLVVAGDVAGLVALLVWLGITLGAA